MTWKAYTGAADGMWGPQRFGWVDQQYVAYGEKGGKYVQGWANVSQKVESVTGDKRVPIWSDKNDDIWVAVPPNLPLEIITEEETEGLVKVHHISRHPDDWNHLYHPKDVSALQIVETLQTRAEEAAKFAQQQYEMMFPTLPSQVEMAKLLGAPKPVSSSAIQSQVSLPIYDQEDGKTKEWIVSSTSKILKELVAQGAVKTTPTGRYYVDPGAKILLKSDNPKVPPKIDPKVPLDTIALIDPGMIGD